MVAAVAFDFKDTLAYVSADGPSIMDIASARGFVIVEKQEATRLISDSSSQQAFEDEVRRARRQTLRRAGATDAEIDDMLAEAEGGRDQLRMELFPEVADVLEDLRAAGVLLAICSNWDWHLDRQLAKLGIAELFAAVICSARCGYWKPHPEIFAIAARSLRLQPPEILFVGDNYRNDIQPALLAGMRALHVHRAPCGSGCGRSGESLKSVTAHLT